MKTFGPLYAAKIRYWHTRPLPVIEVGWTQETEPPFRKGKCLVFRRPTSEYGFALGLFYKTPAIHPDDDDAIDKLLLDALKVNSDTHRSEEIGEWSV